MMNLVFWTEYVHEMDLLGHCGTVFVVDRLYNDSSGMFEFTTIVYNTLLLKEYSNLGQNMQTSNKTNIYTSREFCLYEQHHLIW